MMLERFKIFCTISCKNAENLCNIFLQPGPKRAFSNDMHSYKFNVTHFCNTFLQMALLIEVDTLTKTMMIRKVM